MASDRRILVPRVMLLFSYTASEKNKYLDLFFYVNGGQGGRWQGVGRGLGFGI